MGISERGVYSSPVLTEVVTRCCIQLEATRPIPGGNNVFCPTPLKCWEYQCPFSISFIIQGINKSVVHSNPLLWSTTIDWKYWHSSLPFVVVVMLVKQWQCWQLHCKITYYWGSLHFTTPQLTFCFSHSFLHNICSTSLLCWFLFVCILHHDHVRLNSLQLKMYKYIQCVCVISIYALTLYFVQIKQFSYQLVCKGLLHVT